MQTDPISPTAALDRLRKAFDDRKSGVYTDCLAELIERHDIRALNLAIELTEYHSAVNPLFPPAGGVRKDHQIADPAKAKEHYANIGRLLQEISVDALAQADSAISRHDGSLMLSNPAVRLGTYFALQNINPRSSYLAERLLREAIKEQWCEKNAIFSLKPDIISKLVGNGTRLALDDTHNVFCHLLLDAATLDRNLLQSIKDCIKALQEDDPSLAQQARAQVHLKLANVIETVLSRNEAGATTVTHTNSPMNHIEGDGLTTQKSLAARIRQQFPEPLKPREIAADLVTMLDGTALTRHLEDGNPLTAHLHQIDVAAEATAKSGARQLTVIDGGAGKDEGTTR